MDKNFFILLNNPHIVHGENQRIKFRSNHGRSTEKITCPFCDKQTIAYTWSLHGSGKKCAFCKDVIHGACASSKKFKTAEEAKAWLDNHLKERV